MYTLHTYVLVRFSWPGAHGGVAHAQRPRVRPRIGPPAACRTGCRAYRAPQTGRSRPQRTSRHRRLGTTTVTAGRITRAVKTPRRQRCRCCLRPPASDWNDGRRSSNGPALRWPRGARRYSRGRKSPHHSLHPLSPPHTEVAQTAIRARQCTACGESGFEGRRRTSSGTV